MGAAKLADVVTRFKREDHKRTKHDSQFSKWKVLIGPHDWEDHSVGKGVARYRVENLPKTASSGLYELAINKPSSRDHNGKLDSDKVLVVYLGEADNVRSRLQQYGRTGAHLGRNDSGDNKVCGCFEDIFARGYSIVYRWAPMRSKAAAQRTEAQLLEKYDYAWNKGSNGARRHNDILRKLGKLVSNKKHLPTKIKSNEQENGRRPHLPTKIKSNKQVNGRCRKHLNYGGDLGSSFTPRWLDHGGGGGDITSICGAPTCDGAPCERTVNGNGRCWQHSNYGSSSSYFTPRTLNYGGCDSSFTPRWLDHGGDDIILLCGATTNYGAPSERPVSGNERCWQHLDYSSSSGSSSSSSSSGCFTSRYFEPEWFFLQDDC